MRQEIHIANVVDADGNPAGGTVRGTGIEISWQNGPLGRGEDRQIPNGAFVEDVLYAVASRIEHYQESRFHSLHNAVALGHINAALSVLDERTREREDRDVEGTHKV